MKKHLNLLLLASLFTSTSLLAQTRIYVSANATGAQNGTSWANAYTNLQTAIDAAAANDTIWVKSGTYFPTKFLGASTNVRSKAIQLKTNVHLFGGFAGTETSLSQRTTTNATILSGDLGVANDTSDNAYHVVVGLFTTGLFDQFVITKGNANGPGTELVGGFAITNSLGGGIYLDSSSVHFTNCYITQNTAKVGGGGMYNHKSNTSATQTAFSNNAVVGSNTSAGGGGAMFNYKSNPILYLVQFNGNSCVNAQGGGAIRNEMSNGQMDSVMLFQNFVTNGDGGGAMYNLESNPTLNFAQFTSNTTNEEGGAMYNDGSIPTINDAFFHYNSSSTGGAMENDGGSDVILNRIIFYGNSSLGDGGAIHNWKSDIVCTNVDFVLNTAVGNGGAIKNYNDSSPKITNTWFAENEAGGNGGAFYNERGSHPIITNVLFIKNKAGNKGGAFYNVTSASLPCSPIFTNVTIANNTAVVSGGGAFDDGLGASRLRNSIVYGNHAPTLEDVDAPASIIATAVYNDIIGNSFYANGTSTPVAFTSQIFVDTAMVNYKLVNPSPAISAGDSSFYAPTATPNLSAIVTDIRGAARIMGSNIDLGAYEDCDFVAIPTVSISANPAMPVKKNVAVTFTATATNQGLAPYYFWNINGSNVKMSSDSTFTAIAGVDFQDGDNISVKLLSSIGCAVGEPSDTLLAEISYIGLAEIAKKKSENSIIPNPSNGVFKLKTELEIGQNYQLEITDVRGNRVFESTIRPAANSFEMELNLAEKLPAGMYFLTLSNSKDAKQVARFVIL